MADRNAAFEGTIPQHYDRYLGPLLFHPYADDLAARLVPKPDVRVLEIACGTGLVTRRLLDRLGGSGSILATDLNEAMLAYARSQVVAAPGLQWRQADAVKLPLPDRSFDAVVCQFGLMFFPDKAAALREAFRVLRPGGRFAVSDIVLLRDIPEALRSVVGLWTGCISGALRDHEYVEKLTSAGFTDADVEVTRRYTRDDLEAMAEMTDVTALPDGMALPDLVEALDGAFASAFVRARKP